MRKAYRLKAGSRSRLQWKSEELPPLQDHEVTIEVKAIGLNFADIFAVWGLYGATPKEPFIPGLEYAGVVQAVGKGVDQVKVGDSIMGVTRFGAYTTHLNIDQRYVMPLPEGWSFAEGAAYLVQVLTAYYALKNLAAIKAGDTVLIHSAAGGVGIWANRIAKKFHAFTIGTVGSANKIDLLKKEGYDRWIVRGPDFKGNLQGALGERELNIIMECIGGKIFQIGFETLAQQGRSIIYGAARYASTGSRPNYLKLIYQFLTRPKIDPQRLTEANKAIMGFNLIWLYHKAELMHDLLQELQQLELPPPIVGHEFFFDNLPDAIQLFQTGKTMGKVVVVVP